MCAASATVYVSLPHVLRNMPSIADVAAIWTFFSDAFLHTTAPVQLITLFGIFVGAWLASDVVRVLRYSTPFIGGRIGA